MGIRFINHFNPLFWLSKFYLSYAPVKYKSPWPIVSVGNLSFGGTGKTPFVLWLAHHLSGDPTLSLSVVNRNYKAKSPYPSLVKHTDLAHYVAFGDEAILLKALTSEGVNIFSGPSKWQTVQYLNSWAFSSRAQKRLIILDDGLSHPFLKPDIQIALIRADQSHWDLFFPLGPGRVPYDRLSQVDMVVLTRVNKISQPEKSRLYDKIRSLVRYPDHIWEASYFEIWPDIPQEKKLLLVTSIAQSQGLQEEAKHIFRDQIKIQWQLPDHHTLKWSQIKDLRELVQQDYGILCTRKDWVKLKHFLPSEAFYLIELKIEVEKHETFFKTFFDHLAKTSGWAMESTSI